MDFNPFIGSGCGNTFLVVSQRFCEKNPDRKILDMWKQSGVDSVLLLSPTTKGDVKMFVPGADGIWGKESGEFCGNGSRVVAKFWKLLTGKDPVIVSRSGVCFPSLLEKDVVHVQFPLPEIYGEVILAGGEPHSRVPVDMKISDLLRFCNNRTRRVSANRVTILSANSISVRTFEHSINKFTGCCGTGCISMSYLCHREGLVPSEISVMAPGGSLGMSIGNKTLVMSGPAEITL